MVDNSPSRCPTHVPRAAPNFFQLIHRETRSPKHGEEVVTCYNKYNAKKAVPALQTVLRFTNTYDRPHSEGLMIGGTIEAGRCGDQV